MDKLKEFWRKRDPDSHKGQNGRVLIVGGSPEYIGAPALAGLAALRVGADLVTIAAPEKVAWAINCISPDLITRKLKGERLVPRHAEEVAMLAEKADVVLMGNGFGVEAEGFVKSVMPVIKVPLVLDGGALRIVHPPVGGRGDVQNCLPTGRQALLTPHANEFEAYSGQKIEKDFKRRIKQVMAVACPSGRRAGGSVILLKGKIDIIATAGEYRLNRTGNPGMTKGGTGDVLAGFAAGLIAQGMGMFAAACLASEVNKAIGDKLAAKYGYSYLASEIVRDGRTVRKFLGG